jgi:small subunit ribosomal protein S8
MPVSDSIADFITRIRNGAQAGHKSIDAPRSNMKVAIAKILKEQGFITDFEEINEGPQGIVRVTLKYYNRKPAIYEIKKVSKPGRRLYVSMDNLPRVKSGLGIAIISSSKGVITDKDARKLNVGGEFICTVW